MTKKQFFLAISVVVAVTALVLGYLQNQPKYGTAEIGGERLRVEIADTFAKQKMGLSGREDFGKIGGMLFVFADYGRYGIWMNNMKFPIDVLWLRDGKIVDIAPNLSPEKQKDIYYPRGEANFVLELPAGFASAKELSIGSGLPLDW